ncbi:MAG: alginate lyase family protein [Candidatus Hydrogenedentes bacterium]|nr:alginate lyase family protein [Candidatus Hydrogenedentota bacterium]
MTHIQRIIVCVVLASITMAHTEDATPREALLKTYPQAAKEAITKADKLFALPVKTVMDKTAVAASGDKHDYYSLSPYYWPNPDSADGTPFVNKDGQLNPAAESDDYDRVAYFRMADTVKFCAIAWRLTGEMKYAEKAASTMRAWFVSPATRMKPNLNYAQYVPGVNTGSRTGIIRGMTILELIDCVKIIESSGAWTMEDKTAWSKWLSDFANWLQESEFGIAESKALNNHGTWYDVQVATFALEGGNTELASRMVREAAEKRIAKQILPDGKQPLELMRTKSWDYSVMNLDAMVRLAMLGERVNVDLWNFTPPNGGGIRVAIDYLLPFATGEKDWKAKQLNEFKPEAFYPVLRRAAVAYGNSSYSEALSVFASTLEPIGLDHLMYPAIP